jgi:anti-sigma regulatory factor (Ser/Thr protein kinase)
LEELWNDLQARRGFTLLCGYPRAILRQGSLPLATAVCRQHNDLSICGNAHSVATGVVSSEVFLPSPTSVSAARDFVRRSLNDADGCGDAADVVLVASEMVTNAVRHAGSAFRLTVTREQRSLRLEVEDVSPHPPKAAGATAFDDGGRGLPLIETLTNSWGHYPTSSGGKVVWAQFLP